MDAIEQLKQDVRDRRIGVDRLIDVIVTQQRQLQSAQQRIEELEKKVGGTATAKVDEPFSMRAEEKRQQARHPKKKRQLSRKGRRGRVATADKLKLAERTEKVFPEGLPPQDCQLSHTRPVWRLENGRAVLISYDKVCLVFRFFQNLPLGKSQADALLQQLSRHWHNEFEILCTLLANSLVVHTDETSWSLNSVWAFLSEKARLLFFGVHKDAATLKQILDPATFAGTVISDDAAVYANFTKSQKCWAHLLRKAIKLTLQEPNNAEYRRFTDRLLEIYRSAGRVQRDGRFGDVGRTRKVGELDDAILELCGPIRTLGSRQSSSPTQRLIG